MVRKDRQLILHNLPEAKGDSFFPTECPKCGYDIINEYDDTIISSAPIVEVYTIDGHTWEQTHAHKCPKCGKGFLTFNGN